MKVLIYFVCLCLLTALSYFREVRLIENGAVTQLASFHGSLIGLTLCLLIGSAALAAIWNIRRRLNAYPIHRLFRWKSVPKWPLLAFLPMLFFGMSRGGSFASARGVVEIKYGWGGEQALGLYFATACTVMLIELALRYWKQHQPAR